MLMHALPIPIPVCAAMLAVQRRGKKNSLAIASTVQLGSLH